MTRSGPRVWVKLSGFVIISIISHESMKINRCSLICACSPCSPLSLKASVLQRRAQVGPSQENRGHSTFPPGYVRFLGGQSLGVSAGMGRLVLAGLWVSVWWDARPRSHSPLCRVRRPPDKTPRGSVPVGVSPFSCSTLSFSSLLTHKHNIIRECQLIVSLVRHSC